MADKKTVSGKTKKWAALTLLVLFISAACWWFWQEKEFVFFGSKQKPAVAKEAEQRKKINNLRAAKTEAKQHEEENIIACQGNVIACKTTDKKPSASEIKDMVLAVKSFAVDAYVYAYPIVLMNLISDNAKSAGAVINQFLHRKSLNDVHSILGVRPNVDTYNSYAWIDLSEEPLILHVPNTNGHYYVLQMLDCWINTFTSVGSRTTGNNEKNFIIVGPGWKGNVPTEFFLINAPSNNMAIVGRIQPNGISDSSNIYKLQNQFTLTPLHFWGKKYKAPAVKRSDSIVHPKITPNYEVEAMDAETFFQTFSSIIKNNPPPPQDSLMIKKLAKIGIIAGKDFNFSELDTAIASAFNNAVIKCREKIVSVSKKYSLGKGWKMNIQKMGTYGTDYFRRALIAKRGTIANLPEDAIYTPASNDNGGQPLNGKHNYVIHFDKNKLPPVKAFWSITLYNKEGFLVENTLNRYAISSHLNSLTFNADSSLDVYVQHKSPGKDKEANWLPSPEDKFSLTLRLYWPKQEILNKKWQPPPIKQAN